MFGRMILPLLCLAATSAFASPISMNGQVEQRTTENRVGFSLLHVGPGPSGAITHNLASSPISFVYNDIGNNGLDTGDQVILNNIVIQHSQGGTLTLGGTLTVGAGGFSDPGNTPLGKPTHTIGGDLNFEITGGGADTGVFRASPMQMFGSVFNGIGMNPDGSLAVYLWAGEVGGTNTAYGMDLVFTGAPVPEPATMTLCAIGVAVSAFGARRRARKS